MVASKSGFLYFAVLFYGLIFIMLGTLPVSEDIIQSKGFTDNNNLNFFDKIVLNLEGLPSILNFFFFGSLATIVGYAIITTVLGAILDGGN